MHDLQNRVEQLVLAKKELADVELLRVRKQRTRSEQAFTAEGQSLAELSVTEVFAQRLQQETLSDEQQQQLNDAFQEILAAVSDTAVAQKEVVQ